MTSHPRRILCLAVLCLASASGCRSTGPGWFDLLGPRPAQVSRPPAPDSPVGVIRTLEWCWNHRDTLTYRTVFTDDYRFFFVPNDSVGNAFVHRALSRDQELAFAGAAFVRGTLTEPPPVFIALTFDQNLIVLSDSRQGSSRFHKEIAAQTLLRFDTPDFQVTGVSRFFVVRGDAATWPAGLAHSGPDSLRWFIDQWDDETLGGGFDPDPRLRVLPEKTSSMGQVKALYLTPSLPVFEELGARPGSRVSSR